MQGALRGFPWQKSHPSPSRRGDTEEKLAPLQLSIHGTYTLLRASDPAAPRETRLPLRGWEAVVE